MQYFPEEFDRPAGIRAALRTPPPAFSTGRMDVPTAESSRTLHWGCVTNWASFYQHVVLPGCTQVIHLPVYGTDMPLPAALVIFRPTEDSLALLSMVCSEAHRACLARSEAIREASGPSVRSS